MIVDAQTETVEEGKVNNSMKLNETSCSSRQMVEKCFERVRPHQMVSFFSDPELTVFNLYKVDCLENCEIGQENGVLTKK